jgi:hypothetical protein
MHGSFCFVQSDKFSKADKCRGGASTWKWLVGPLVIYIVEKMVREYLSKSIFNTRFQTSCNIKDCPASFKCGSSKSWI